MSQHRIKVRMGDVEFDAEGDGFVVASQYESFLETLRLLRGLDRKQATPALPSEQPVASTSEEPVPAGESSADTGESGEDNSALANVELLRELIDEHARLFKVRDRGEVVVPGLSLRELSPQDALLVLLLGYVVKKEEDTLTGIWLTRSMRGSGYPDVGRVDELIENPEFISTSGQFRGKRYSLTFDGALAAFDVLERVFKEGSDAQSARVSDGSPAPSEA